MNIPVVIEEQTGADRRDDVLVGGVPVPRGELAEGGWFALKGEDGREFLVEGTPAAFWPDGSVKWLHLCGLVDLLGGKRSAFSLIAGAAPPDTRLSVETEDQCVMVRGGALEVDLRADASALLSVRRGGEALLKGPGVSAKLVLAGPDGGERRGYVLSVESCTIEVQTANRVVVRLGGSFFDEENSCVSELILFVEVLREAPEIRLEPVFIYLGRPDEDLVASLTLTVHSTLGGGDECAYAFSNERGRGYRDVVRRIEGGPRWPMARQVQLGSTFFRTEKRTFAESSWVKAVEGRRSQGWCHLRDERGAVTAATRYFWQEYPRSMSVDADAGTLTFGLVPPEAAPLDLRRYSPIIYGKPVYEASEGPWPSETHGACGTAKAHELMLRFHAPDEDDAPERGLFFTRPCRVMAGPEHFAAANVVGQVAPVGEGPVEEELARIADFLVGERERRGWYGLMNFGDVMCAYYRDRDSWAFDDGGYAWINTEHLPDLGLWLSALRAARSDWLDAAVEMSRHNRDVDCYHRGLLKGGGTRHNVNHWGCQDKEWRVSMPLVRRLHYYVTADPWTREAILETVAVYQSYERTARTAPSMTSALAGVMAKWEMTHDAEDEETVRNFADTYARAIRPGGQWPDKLHADLATGVGEPDGEELHEAYFFMDGFGGQHALVELAELLGHEALSDALIAHLRFRLAAQPDGRHVALLPSLAHAYRRTGEGALLAAIREALAAAKAQFEETGGQGILTEPKHTVLAGATRKNKIACSLGGHLHSAPYGLAALQTPQPRSGG